MGVCNFSTTGVQTTRNAAISTAVGTSGIGDFRTGAPPADASVTATGTLLSTHTFSATFGVGTAGVSGGAAAYTTANAIASANGVATGTPGYFRVRTSGGVGVVDLDVGVSGSGASVIINPGTITSGAPVSISSLVITG